MAFMEYLIVAKQVLRQKNKMMYLKCDSISRPSETFRQSRKTQLSIRSVF